MLWNITQIETGRALLLNHNLNIHEKGGQILPSFIQSLLLQILSSRNLIRRRGCAGTIKNICRDEHVVNSWLISPNCPVPKENDDILFGLLYPLAGPTEEFNDEEERELIDDCSKNFEKEKNTLI